MNNGCNSPTSRHEMISNWLTCNQNQLIANLSDTMNMISLRNVEYPFISVTHRSILTWTGSTR